MKREPGLEIIHQDESLVAVNKASGLAILPGRGRTENLLEKLRAEPALAGLTPLVVHRLDADTSGVIVFALTPEAQRHLAEQFRNRTVTKEYWALVRGTPLNESGSVDLPIGRDPHDKNRMTVRGMDAKPARTKWVVAQRFTGRGGARGDGMGRGHGSDGGGADGALGQAMGARGDAGGGGAAVTLLKVFPVTGRRHQIRVHLKAMGYPLAVDPYYGGTSLLLSEFKKKYKLGKFQTERPLMERLTLHAYEIAIHHPTQMREFVLRAELAKDFKSSLTALQKWAT